jgi:hypothetical protein
MEVSNKQKQKEKHVQETARAEFKCRFFRKIRYFCELAGSPDLYQKIPPQHLESLYRQRFLPLTIEAAAGETIPRDVIADCRLIIPLKMKEEMVSWVQGAPPVSLHDALYFGFGLFHLIDELTEHASPASADILRGLAPLGTLKEQGGMIYNHLNKVLMVAGIINSTLDSSLYGITTTMDAKITGVQGIQMKVILHRFTPEKKYIFFDGACRPVIRVGWPLLEAGMNYLSIAPSDLGLVDMRNGKHYNVYVQSHALQRLSERLDCIGVPALHLQLYLSLSNLKVFHREDGIILIEYRFDETKLGYFKASLHQDMLILRTFLFITNDGTPEGKRLREVCGLDRLDKVYLNLDKLSSFMNEELGNHPEIRRLLLQAHCESLLELYTNVRIVATKPIKPLSMQTVIKYLGLDERKDFLTTLTEKEEEKEEVYSMV